MKWFRLYHDLLDNPKVQQLDGSAFKTWVNLLCVASRSDERGTLPHINKLAFLLRSSPYQISIDLDALITAGLVTFADDCYALHDWDHWQRASDNVAERVQRHRSKPPEEKRGDTDKDTEGNLVTGNEPVTLQAKITKSSRMKESDTLPDEWFTVASLIGLPDERIADQFLRFRDYWIAQPGQKGLKADWLATWRNWIRREKDRIDLWNKAQVTNYVPVVKPVTDAVKELEDRIAYLSSPDCTEYTPELRAVYVASLEDQLAKAKGKS